MKKNPVIEDTISEAANKFRRSLDKFYPAHGESGFNERNLTFQFVHTFANRPLASGFMEVPFLNKETNRHDNRIDAYAFDNKIGVFIESKRLYSIEKEKSILGDLERMNEENISYILNECHIKRSYHPSEIYALVLIESWSVDINSKWIKGEIENLNGDDGGFPYEMFYGECKIKEWEEDSSAVYWLYGYRQLNI